MKTHAIRNEWNSIRQIFMFTVSKYHERPLGRDTVVMVIHPPSPWWPAGDRSVIRGPKKKCGSPLRNNDMFRVIRFYFQTKQSCYYTRVWIWVHYRVSPVPLWNDVIYLLFDTRLLNVYKMKKNLLCFPKILTSFSLWSNNDLGISQRASCYSFRFFILYIYSSKAFF